MEVIAVFLMRMSAECKWSRLAPQLGGWHWSGYELVFVEMPTLLYGFWFARFSDVTRYSALLSLWAYLVWAKTHASPRMIGFLDGTWREVCKPLLDVLQRKLLVAVQPLSQGARSQVPSAIDVVTVSLSEEVGDALKRRRPPLGLAQLPTGAQTVCALGSVPLIPILVQARSHGPQVHPVQATRQIRSLLLQSCQICTLFKTNWLQLRESGTSRSESGGGCWAAALGYVADDRRDCM
jgi:hypothetical protein